MSDVAWGHLENISLIIAAAAVVIAWIRRNR